VLGSGHTFNHIADTNTNGVFVSLVKMKDVVVGENTVTFGAGCIYADLLKVVDQAGKALPNLPSLPHINIVGSVVTGTHGSGYNQPMLVSHAQSIEMVFADGSVRTINKSEDPNFYYYI
jgi:xylitol oxidase